MKPEGRLKQAIIAKIVSAWRASFSRGQAQLEFGSPMLIEKTIDLVLALAGIDPAESPEPVDGFVDLRIDGDPGKCELNRQSLLRPFPVGVERILNPHLRSCALTLRFGSQRGWFTIKFDGRRTHRTSVVIHHEVDFVSSGDVTYLVTVYRENVWAAGPTQVLRPDDEGVQSPVTQGQSGRPGSNHLATLGPDHGPGCEERGHHADRDRGDRSNGGGSLPGIEAHGPEAIPSVGPESIASVIPNTREILILTDTKTGRQYLGITGVGVSELVTETTVRVSSDGKGHMTTVPDVETVER